MNKTTQLLLILLLLVSLCSINYALPLREDIALSVEKTTSPSFFTSQNGWPQIYDEGYQDNAQSMDIDSQDNVIVTGFSAKGSVCDAYTIKYDAEGNELWNATYNSGTNDVGFCLIVDPYDNILIYGYSGNLPISEGDCFLLKYTPDGTEQWNITFSKGECDFPGDIALDSNDNIILTGGSGIWQMNMFYWTQKLDKTGAMLWNHSFHEAAIDIGLAVTVDSQNHIITTGISSTPFVDPLVLIKYSTDGGIIWEKRLAGSEPWDITTDSQDNIILTGTRYENQTLIMQTVKCTSEGTVLWNDVYNSGGYDGGRSIVVDAYDNIIVGGFSGFSHPNHFEHCLLIYDQEGTQLCLKRERVEGIIYDVAINSNDDVYITGSIEEGIRGYYTTRYDDLSPPDITMDNPTHQYLHLGGIPLLPLPKNTIVLGKLIVQCTASAPSDIQLVEIYIDSYPMMTLLQPPFEWTWEDSATGEHSCTVLAYDNTGTAQKIELSFWKFF